MGNARSARLAVTEQRLDHIARFAFASWLLNIRCCGSGWIALLFTGSDFSKTDIEAA